MDNSISPEAPRPNPALRKPWLGSGSPGGPSSPPKLSAVSPVHVEGLVGNGKERPKSGHPVEKTNSSRTSALSNLYSNMTHYQITITAH